MNTPACVLDKGRAQLEAGIATWSREHDTESRTMSFGVADVLVRYGLTSTTEVRAAWLAFGHSATRARSSGRVERASGVGDVEFSVRQNVISPSGDDLSLAVLPFLTFGVGGEIGSRSWSGGLIVPVSYDLGHGVKLQLSPEIDAAPNESGDGRHLAYGTAGGLGISLSDAVGLAVEARMVRDRDPEGHTSATVAGVSLGWVFSRDWQADFSATAGLDRPAADVEISVGFSRRF